MHELSITKSIVDQVQARMGDAQIRRMQVEIGKLSGIVPDSVQFCFEMVVVGTTLEGAVLEVVEPFGSAHCHDCGADFPTDEVLPLCRCGSADIQVLGGQELRIREVEVVECARPADAHP